MLYLQNIEMKKCFFILFLLLSSETGERTILLVIRAVFLNPSEFVTRLKAKKYNSNDKNRTIGHTFNVVFFLRITTLLT